MAATGADNLTSALPTATGDLEERGYECLNRQCALELVSKCIWTLGCGVTHFLQHSAFEKDNKRVYKNHTPTSADSRRERTLNEVSEDVSGKASVGELINQFIVSFIGHIDETNG